MHKLTAAQQRLVDRAKERDVYRGIQRDCELCSTARGYNRLVELAEKYNKPLYGGTVLTGSADFRVAYRLEDMGVGNLASCPISDRWFFTLREDV